MNETYDPDVIKTAFEKIITSRGKDYLDAKKVIINLGEKSIAFLENLANLEDWQKQTFSLLLLQQIREPEKYLDLREKLQDNITFCYRFVNPYSPRFSGYLKGFKSENTIPFLVEILLKDWGDDRKSNFGFFQHKNSNLSANNDLIRAIAAYALGEIDNLSAMEPLIEALKQEIQTEATDCKE
ncbi:MAG: hypothetical protein ACMUJM_24170 [bacterium]